MKSPKPGKSGDRLSAIRVSSSSAAARTRGGLASLLLVVIILAAYLPALQCGYIWDDDDYVTNNRALRSFDGLGRIWFEPGATPQYYPLTFTSFWIEYQIWKLNPAGYHLTNMLLQGLNACLLFIILRRLAVPGAWLAAALFAVHPVQVESVAWITERKNVLCGAFYLAAAWAWLHHMGLAHGGFAEAGLLGRRRWYFLSLVLFICALLGKTVACTWPAAVLLVLWWKRGRILRRDVLGLLPFFILGMGMGLATAWLERSHVGAVGEEWSLSWLQRLLLAGRIPWFYLAKLLWPHPIIFIYPRWQIDAANWSHYLYPVATTAVLVTLWLARHRAGRGPVTAALFFVGTLLPALGFVNVYPMRYSYVADHFAYLATLSLLVALAAALTTVLNPNQTLPGRASTARWRGPMTVRAVSTVILVVLCMLTWRQIGKYADAETLWRDTLRKNPAAWMAHNNLGELLMRRGDLDESINHFTKAIEWKPDHAGAYNNRGTACRKMRRYDRALEDYAKAIELRPDYAEAFSNRGNTYWRMGDLDRAIQEYDRAIGLKPDYADAWYNRGIASAGMNDPDRALRDYTRAVELRPDHAGARYNRGNLYSRMGDFARAAEDYSKAIESEPDSPDAYRNRAVAYYYLKKYDKAWSDIRQCRRLGGTVVPDLVRKLTDATRLHPTSVP
ncbi:MAG TPA: tetratricopeptide repeat protein [Phycisphaerae bacterium]|nr:tetratricopeptide repeat protein [Phycisphaerae bacterium]